MNRSSSLITLVARNFLRTFLTRNIFIFTLLLLSLSFIPSGARASYNYYDDTSSYIIYGPNTANWTTSSGVYRRASASTLHWTNIANSYAVLTFSGSSITYKYTMAPGRGSARIYIDNIFIATFSAYSADTRFQVAKTWSVSNGTHTIKVEAVGNGYVDIDAFIVDEIYMTGNDNYVDDSTAPLRYIYDTIPWTQSSSYPLAYNRTVSQSNIMQDAVTFTFKGDQIRYFFTKASGRGKSVVTIDGVEKEIIGAYSANNIWQYSLDYRGLGQGIHTIHISNLHQKNPASSGYYTDLDTFWLSGCPKPFPYCRAYAYAEKSTTNTYTAIRANITQANPIIRDGGFSAAVLWIPTASGTIEIGWQRDMAYFGGTPYLYWGYYNPGWNGPIIEPSTTDHRFELVHLSSTNKWHVFIDGADRGSISLGASSGYLVAGGEVSDYIAGSRNDMGISNFTNLQFQRNHGPWTDWNGWDYKHEDYDYYLFGTTPNSFQICGYNCGGGGGG